MLPLRSAPVAAFAFLLMLAVACAPSGPPEVSGDDDDDDGPPAIDADIAAALAAALADQYDVHAPPGIVAAVQLPDHRVWVGAVGVSDLDTEAALGGGELFKIGSVTKTFTAALLMTLVEDGALALDDPMGDWIDDHPRASDITLRQLLQHTAGVPEYSGTATFQAGGARAWTDAELVALVAGADLHHEPGASYRYSNTHYVMLGMVVEEELGLPWQEAMRDLVVTPTGLDATTVPGATDGWGQVVRGYLGDTDLTDSIHPSAIGAAGNVVSRAADVAVWARALWGGGVLSAEGTAALSADPVAMNAFAGYGLATIVLDDGTGLQLAHNGALNGYVAWAGYRPDLDAGLAVVANGWLSGNPPDVGYTSEISDALWGVLVD